MPESLAYENSNQEIGGFEILQVEIWSRGKVYYEVRLRQIGSEKELSLVQTEDLELANNYYNHTVIWLQALVEID